ncbi:hypothetical protein ACQJBY_039096 [Aegilops geniculata]
MATAEEVGNGLEFLSDPVDRFPLLDLASSDFNPAGEPDTCVTQSAVESSMGDIGDAPLTIQVAGNNGCEELSLSAADSQQSTGKDDPQAPVGQKGFVLGEPLSSVHLVLEEYVPLRKH